ncbi:MAG: RNA-binding S4 domain-containing protein [Cephaloticoccus sp.]|nr:RNA-binding S4 domain-containing protein [Cephaloticoccus sp.]
MVESSSSPEQTIVIRAQPIELCQLLKFAGLTESGGTAKQAIASGLVELNGVKETQKRKKVMSGDRVSYNGHALLVKLPG